MTDETDALTKAVADWVGAVLPRLHPDQSDVLDAMLDGRCDVAIETRLRKGTVELVALDEVGGRRSVLWRQDVAPLRPDTGFGPDPNRQQ